MTFIHVLLRKLVVAQGEILIELKRQLPGDCQFSGYEISPDAFAMCSRSAEDRVDFYLEDMLQSDTTVDLALVMDVVEHVEDYFSFLRQLKPRGEYKLIHIPLALSASAVLRNRPLNEAQSESRPHPLLLA